MRGVNAMMMRGNELLSKAKFIAGAIIIALLHLGFFSVGYVQANVEPALNTKTWGIVSMVLGLPLVAIARRIQYVDVFPIAVYANSILWGIGCVMLVRWIKQRWVNRSHESINR